MSQKPKTKKEIEEATKKAVSAIKNQVDNILNKKKVVGKPAIKKADMVKDTEPKPAEEITPEVTTPEVTTPEVTTPPTTEQAPVFSIMGDLAGTEQDVKEFSKMESMANSFVDEAHFDKTNEQEDSEEVRKQNAKVSANTIVTFIDIVFMLLACFIAKDFSDQKQAKFSLIPEKKKAMANNIYQLLMLRKKKSNPVVSLVLGIVGAYVPMLLIAFMERKNRAKEEREQAQRLAEIAAKQQADKEPLNTYSFKEENREVLKKENPAEFSTIRQQVIKTDKRGRHKKTCASMRGEKCNCK